MSGRLGHTTIRMTADTSVGMFEAGDLDVADRLDAMARDAVGSSERLSPADGGAILNE